MNKASFKAMRLQKGMTQKEFADLLRVSESTVAAIETGRRCISDTVRARIAQNIEVNQELILFLGMYQELDNIISPKQ